jgi:hypothetical protein
VAGRASKSYSKWKVQHVIGTASKWYSKWTVAKQAVTRDTLIQSAPSNLFPWRHILIPSSHLHLALLNSPFPLIILYKFFISHIHDTWTSRFILIIFHEKNKLRCFLIWNFLQSTLIYPLICLSPVPCQYWSCQECLVYSEIWHYVRVVSLIGTKPHGVTSRRE